MPRRSLGLLSLQFLVAAALVLAGNNLALAQQTWDFGAANQDWDAPLNWSGNVVPSGQNAIINTSTAGQFPVILSGDITFTPVDILIANGGATTGRVDQRTGALSTGNGNWVFVGNGGTSVGSFNLADTSGVGGALTGFATGSGSLNIGAANAASGRLNLGNGGTSVGTFNMNTSGTLTTTDNAIGMLLGTNGGDGIFNLDAGTVNTEIVWLGDNNVGSDGTLNISGGTFDATGEIFVGRQNGNGTINMTGGTLTAQDIRFARSTAAGNTGDGSGTVGAGATMNVKGFAEVGFGGTAAAVGSLTVGGTLNVNTTGGGGLAVGTFDAAAATVTVNSGAIVRIQNNAEIAFANGGNTGIAAFNHNGGSVTFYSDAGVTVGGTGGLDLHNAGAAAGSRTYTLGNGALSTATLTTPQIRAGVSPVGDSRVFNFNGGTLRPTATSATFFNAGVATSANVLAGGAKIDTNTFDVTIAQALLDGGGGGGLTKNGAGTLALTGANTFTGNLTVNAGILAAGLGLGNPGANVSQSSAVGDIGTGVSRRLIVNNGGTLSLTAGNTLGTGGSTNTLSGVTLEVNSGGLFRTGLDAAGAGWWNKMGAVDLNGGTISVGSGANNTTFQGLALIGTVTVGGSTASTINNLASSDSAFNAIHLGQNAAAGQSITFNVANVTGDANADLTIAAKLINTSLNLTASGLTKTGAGTMVLTGANAFSGNVNIDAGTLRADRGNNVLNPANSALGNPQAARNINVNNGGALQFVQGDTLGGADTNVVSTLVINQGALVTNTGNNFTTLGPVNLNGGTLTGTGGAIAGYQMYNLRGTVSVGGTAMSTISASGANAGYHLAAPTTFNVGDATLSSATDLLVSGNLIDQDATHGGSGSLLKTGAGTMELSGANTYTGDTFVKGGTLALTGSINSSAGRVIVGNAGGTAALTIAGGSSLTTSEFVIGDNDAGYSGAPTTLSGTATMAGGTLTASNWLLLGRQAGTGVFNQQGGTVTNSSTATGYVAVGWHFAGAGSTGTYNLTNNAVLNANSAVNYGGIGPTSIVIANLAGDNGLMTLSNTAQVTASNRVVLAAQGGTGTLTLNDSSSLSLTGAGGNGGVLVFAGTGNININGGTLSANYLTLGQNGGSNGTLTQTGGTVSLTTLWTTFNGTGTYNLDGGTLSVAGFNKGAGSGTMYFNGGTLQATASWTLGGGNVTTTQIRNGGLIIDTNGQNPTISNVLAHSTVGGDNALDGGLTKNNGGTLTLTGSNTFTGGTTINAGTIITATVGAPAAGALGTGPVTVNAGTTLQSNTGDSFGWFGGAPSVININGGTVTTGGVGNFRTTLPDLNMTGGAITSAAGNAGDASGVFSMNAGSDVTVNGSPITSTIGTGNPAAGFGLQDVHTFDVANGAAAVDLLVSANLTNVTYLPATPGGVTKTGAGLMRLSGTNTYTGNTLSNGGILDVSATGSITQSNEIWAAQGGSGRIDVNGGAIASPNFIVAGRQDGAGIINLNTGSATSGFAVSVGALRPTGINSTVGIFNVGGGASAATLTTDELWIAEGFGGGANPVSGTMNVFNNGAVNVANFTIVGFHNAAIGTLNVNAGSLTTADLVVGSEAGSIGQVNQAGGVVSVTNINSLDVGLGGSGEYNLSGGTLNVAGHAYLGDAGGSGDFNHTGGTANITRDLNLGDNNNATLNNYNLSNNGDLNFGDSAGVAAHWGPGTDPASSININSDGAFNFTGGTLRDVTTINTSGGAGTFTQSGGSFYIGQDEGPGGYARETTIDGGFSLLGGTVYLDVFGADLTPDQCCDGVASQNDQLTVEGAALLNGTISLDFEGFTPAFGEVFTLVCAESITLDDGFHIDGGFFRLVPTGNEEFPFALQAIVPEPASLAVWTIIGLAGAAAMCRTRRTLR